MVTNNRQSILLPKRMLQDCAGTRSIIFVLFAPATAVIAGSPMGCGGGGTHCRHHTVQIGEGTQLSFNAMDDYSVAAYDVTS